MEKIWENTFSGKKKYPTLERATVDMSNAPPVQLQGLAHPCIYQVWRNWDTANVLQMYFWSYTKYEPSFQNWKYNFYLYE